MIEKTITRFTYLTRWSLLLIIIGLSFGSLGAAEAAQEDSLQNSQNKNLVSEIQRTLLEHKILSRMYPLMFREDLVDSSIPDLDADFEAWRGKRIARINIIPKDVFLPPQDAKAPHFYKDLVRLGNYLHPRTREKLIREQLFFAVGDSLEPAYLISNLHFLYDQALYSELEFNIVDLGNDEIAINVLVRDKFFLQVSGRYVSRDKYDIRITDRNFLGSGHSLVNTWYVDPQNQGSIGWQSSFSDPNILGTFFQGDALWTDLPGKRAFDVQIQRPFLYPLFQYSGGGDFLQSSISPPQDSISVQKTEAGVWIARNFPCFQYPRYAYAAISLDQTWYQKRPSSHPESGMPWQESLFALAALALTQSSYRFMPRVSSFLDNDYLPEGYLLELYGAYDFGEYKNRPFVGIQGSWSIFPDDDRFFYMKGALETFFDEGNPEQSVFALEPMYISKTRSIGRVNGRSFIRARIIRSHKRWQTERISLSSDPFYRGSRDMVGTDLAFLSLEEDLALPVSWFGFQITTFGFVDLAVMRDRFQDPDSARSFFSQGIGLRLRNPSLIWDFIELSVGVDQSPKSNPSFRLRLKLKQASSLQDFKGKRPQRYPFE
jgi:hypothetical protein